MGNLNKLSLDEIRRAHGPKIEYERYLPASRFLFRPAGFAAAWLAIRLGISAEGAAWLSGAAALGGFLCFMLPSGPALWSGVALLMAFNLLDCVDGSIARATRTQNPYGRFLDSIMGWADMLFWAMAGYVAWTMPELRSFRAVACLSGGYWVAAGFLAAFFSVYGGYLERTFDEILREHWEKLMPAGEAPQSANPLAGKSGFSFWGRIIAHNLKVRETHYLLFSGACVFGCLDALLAFFLVFNAVYVLMLLFVYCRRGSAIRLAGLGRAAGAETAGI